MAGAWASLAKGLAAGAGLAIGEGSVCKARTAPPTGKPTSIDGCAKTGAGVVGVGLDVIALAAVWGKGMG